MTAQSDHDPDLGRFRPPEQAQEAVYDVAFLLHNFVVLRQLGIIDERYLATLHGSSPDPLSA